MFHVKSVTDSLPVTLDAAHALTSYRFYQSIPSHRSLLCDQTKVEAPHPYLTLKSKSRFMHSSFRYSRLDMETLAAFSIHTNFLLFTVPRTGFHFFKISKSTG